MAAGLGFKDFTTGEVLTANDVDGYLMQGVWVFASAAARTSAVPSPQEGNMSFLKDTNSTEYYSGSAWVAVAGAGGGAYTELATGSLSGTSVTLSSINQTYKHLYLAIINAQASSGRAGLRINGNTAADYGYNRIEFTNTAATATTSATQINPGGDLSSLVGRQTTFFIENYATTSYKPITVKYQTSSSPYNSSNGFGFFDSTAAYTSLTIVNTDGVSYTAGTYTLYGVN
jgi:hypothetical protein